MSLTGFLLGVGSLTSFSLAVALDFLSVSVEVLSLGTFSAIGSSVLEIGLALEEPPSGVPNATTIPLISSGILSETK